MNTAIIASLATPDMAEILGAAIGASIGLFLLFVVAYYVLYIVANWKIFTKAGEAGWKSIIPFYNEYIRYKISWKTAYFWIFLALVLAGSFLSGLGPDGGYLDAIGSVIILAGVIIEIISLYFLSKSYGHGAGYFIGLMFLPWLFALIIGFGSSTYQGPQNNER